MQNYFYLRIKIYIRIFVIGLFYFYGHSLALHAQQHRPFVVIELFTSQGCSSCPPADQILGELVHSDLAEENIIFPLSFHVDYWNYIGWKDPFSSEANTDRQRKYAQKLKSSSVYTPQAILNGREHFGGYRGDLMKAGIERELKQVAPLSISLELRGERADNLTLEYTITGDIKDTIFNIALVERNLTTAVKRGENTGRTIKNDNVVRSFQTIGLKDGRGSVSVSIPPGIDIHNSSIITYIQDERTFEVLAAQRTKLQ